MSLGLAQICRFRASGMRAGTQGEFNVGLLSESGTKVKHLNVNGLNTLLQSPNPLDYINDLASRPMGEFNSSEVKFLPPIEAPSSVWGVYAIPKEQRLNGNVGLFPKGEASMIKGPGENLTIKRDSNLTVPEVELVLITTGGEGGKVVALTMGNDMSAKDIIKGHPSYLSRGKLWNGSCALGPSILVGAIEDIAREFKASLAITRGGTNLFPVEAKAIADRIDGFEQLRRQLHDEVDFPGLTYLMTGSLAPVPADFRLQHGDIVDMEIVGVPGIGRLTNPVIKLS